MNFFLGIFKRFCKTFLQNTFHRMLLTFDCCFHIGKAECLKKRLFITSQKDIYRGALKKWISRKGDLKNYIFFFFFFSSFCSVCGSFTSNFHFNGNFSWVEKLNQNNGLYITVTYLKCSKCYVTQMGWWGAKFQSSQVLVFHN